MSTALDATTSSSAVSSGAFSAAATGTGPGAMTVLALAGAGLAALITLLSLLTPLQRPIVFISLTERPG